MIENSLKYNRRKLDRIREAWCRRPPSRWPAEDRKNVTIVLNGLCITDIPTFYIALGKAVNGPDGYYGGCLNGLEDCLYGGFGLRPPFTLEVIGLEQIHAALNASAEAWDEGWSDDPQAPREPSYFDQVIEILTRHRVTVREYGQSQ